MKPSRFIRFALWLGGYKWDSITVGTYNWPEVLQVIYKKPRRK